MRRHPSRRMLLVNVGCLAFVLVMGLFLLVRRTDSGPDWGEADVFAAPAAPAAKKPAAGDVSSPDAGPTGDAGATGNAAATSGDAGTASDIEPIDLAIAPDGGVPF